MWKLESREGILETVPFTVEKRLFSTDTIGTPAPHPYYTIATADWVNVLALTRTQEVLLVRQFRAGSLSATLETPGGVIEPHERDTTMAAVRELEEETGYTSQRLLSLGHFNPNPAMQSNRLHCFLALDCVPQLPRQRFPDASESIEVVRVPLADLDNLVRTGRIDSSLCCLTVLLAQKHLPKVEGPL